MIQVSVGGRESLRPSAGGCWLSNEAEYTTYYTCSMGLGLDQFFVTFYVFSLWLAQNFLHVFTTVGTKGADEAICEVPEGCERNTFWWKTILAEFHERTVLLVTCNV